MRLGKKCLAAISMMVLIFMLLPLHVQAATIKNNGNWGISININAQPYTTFKNYEYGYLAYTDGGCGWFASSRVNQLTGKGNTIWNGQGWWDWGASRLGFKKSVSNNEIKAPALICYHKNAYGFYHVAVLEKFVDKNNVIISEGGHSDYPNNGFCVIRKVPISQIKVGYNGGFGKVRGYVYLPGAKPYNNCSHSWSAYKTTKEPTASATGTWTRTCSKCSEKENVTIPALKAANLREGKYRIVSKLGSNLYVSVAPYQCRSKGNIELYSKGVADQVFTLKKQSNGTYLIKYSSFVFDVDNGAYAGNVQLLEPNGMKPQEWYIVPAGDGWYRLTSRKTYYNLDVSNGRTVNGTNIGTWINNGAKAQQFKFEFIPCTTHQWDAGVVTKQATETEEGEKTFTCQVCGDTKKEKFSKLHTHHYEVVSRKPATCTEDAQVVFACSCGDTWTGTGDMTTYGEWRTTMPSVSGNTQVETKVQYQYSTCGTAWQQTGTGTIDYATGWTSGFNKSHSLYSKYNKTPKTASETATEKVTVSNSKVGYIYYHWCMGKTLEHTYNRTIMSNKTSTHPTFHAFYSTENLALNTSANARKKDNYSVCKDTWWWLDERITINRCSYTTYKKAADGNWSAWSAWQDEEVTPTDTRMVKKRTLYRTVSMTPGTATGHNWGPWVKKGSKYQRVCKNDSSHVQTSANVTATLASLYQVEADMHFHPSEETPEKSSSFTLLQLRYTKAAKKSIKLKWTKVKGAKKYALYGAHCGSMYEKLGELTKTSYTMKKLDPAKYYKFYVIAISGSNTVLAQSKSIHVATAGGKIGNYKSVKLTNVKKKVLTLKKGKSFKIKGKAIPESKKKVNQHRKLAFESSNPDVVKVGKKGKITAKKPGTATIFVYSQSGTFAKLKVKVKK